MHESKYTVPILMYHSISQCAGAKFQPFAVSPEAFAAQMAYLSRSGYTTLTVSQFVQALTNQQAVLPERAVVLTFDDGFADFFSAAFPLLLHYHFTATLYVSTAFLNGTSRWLVAEQETTRPILTWEQLSQISAGAIECGAHSHSHPQLDVLASNTARWEITRSKCLLEHHLHREVQSFAYPFGYHTAVTRRLVQEAGFASACAVRPALCGAPDDPFTLRRRMVHARLSLQEFAALLTRRRVWSEVADDLWHRYLLAPTWRSIRRYTVSRVSLSQEVR